MEVGKTTEMKQPILEQRTHVAIVRVAGMKIPMSLEVRISYVPVFEEGI